MSKVEVGRALISVSDKTGVVDFAAGLTKAGVTVLSSGGTAAELTAAGIRVTSVAEVTGAAEILGGRVKTLHPKIHGAILADPDNEAHGVDLAAHRIEPIQLVVANLYPFVETVADPAVAFADAIEQIDIGGPTMIRAAAKNHAHVGVVTSPGQYAAVLAAVLDGGLDDQTRHDLASRAFYVTAAYDAAIVRWLERDDDVPQHLVLALERRASLRYGENPHQSAAAYAEAAARPWWVEGRQLQGKDMSFNNYLDTEAAWRVVADFEHPAAVVVKHANPCGLAVAGSAAEAFAAAWECDPVSAFGGVVAVNRPLDGATAERILAAGFVEVVVAPQVLPEARSALEARVNLRLLEAPPPSPRDPDLRRVEGGFVVQRRDSAKPQTETWRVAGAHEPSRAQLADLEFAWVVAAHTKSNAIVVARNGAAVGVGAGDQSRVGAAERALSKAGPRAEGAVAASDAFLPFRDALDTLAQAGVTAVIEPGGSKRDEEVIEAADEHGIALVFTQRRHFRH